MDRGDGGDGGEDGGDGGDGGDVNLEDRLSISVSTASGVLSEGEGEGS